MEYISLGKIIGTRGLRGEMKIYSTTDFAKKRYKINNSLYIFNPTNNERRNVTVKSFHKKDKFDYVSFFEIMTIEDAEKLKGWFVEAQKKQEDLPHGYFFYDDLKMCEVYSEENTFIGKVKNIEEYGAQKTLRIARENKTDILVPFINAFIKEVNIKKHIIIIHVIEGLL